MKSVRNLVIYASLFFLSGILPLPAEENRPTVALVLEGGGAWGFAHVGVLKVIEELGIPVDIVIGSSMGSIVGGLYATGYSASEIEGISANADWADLFLEGRGKSDISCRESKDRSTYAAGVKVNRKGFTISGGLLTGNKILRFFDSLLASSVIPEDFDELPRRYRAVATDISTGERVVFSKGSIADAMRASMSIPGVFDPYFYEGRYLVDGGVVDNLPVDLARSMGADIVIAVDLHYGALEDPALLYQSPITALGRSLQILMRNPVERNLLLADLVIEVDMGSFIQTDYAKAKGIADLGEKTARSEIGKFAAIKERVPDPPEAKERDIKTAGTIIVKGGTEKENAAVKNLFAPVRNTAARSEDLLEIFGILDRSDRFDLVRVRRENQTPDYPLVVTLRDKPAEKTELKFGFLYESTFTHTTVGNLDLLPAAFIRGLTTDDSELRVEGEMLDTPDISISFIQPIGAFFSVTPYYAYERNSTTRIEDTSINIQYQTASHTAGIAFDLTPVAGIDWNLGWHYDWIAEQRLPDVRASTDVRTASMLETSVDIRKLDSPVFPMDGISAWFKFSLSLEQLASERFFRVLETKGSTFLSLDTPFSLALLWAAGTDFSTSGDDPDAAPPFYKPDLGGRRMFPGPLTTDEQIGSHVAGLGLELKHNLNWKSRGITLPVFLIVHTAVGAVIQNPSATDWGIDVFHGNATAGLGLRVSDGFGASLRAGVHRSINSEYIPFIALDLGAIGL